MNINAITDLLKRQIPVVTLRAAFRFFRSHQLFAAPQMQSFGGFAGLGFTPGKQTKAKAPKRKAHPMAGFGDSDDEDTEEFDAEEEEEEEERAGPSRNSRRKQPAAKKTAKRVVAEEEPESEEEEPAPKKKTRAAAAAKSKSPAKSPPSSKQRKATPPRRKQAPGNRKSPAKRSRSAPTPVEEPEEESFEAGEEESDGRIFEVGDILKKAFMPDGKIMYKVRWQGFGPEEDSYEPAENLGACKAAIKKFEDSLAKASGKKGKKVLAA